jgi:hypothetical protein
MDRGRIRTQEEASMSEILWMTKDMVRVLTRVSFFSPIFFWEIPNFWGAIPQEKKFWKKAPACVSPLLCLCLAQNFVNIIYIHAHI